MTIDMYSNTDPLNKITKSPQNLSVQYTGQLTDESSIINPTILIDAETIQGNYCYIGDFGRYYYITNITSVKNRLWRVEMHVDVLYTYSTQILANSAILAKSSDTFNLYLNDNDYRCYQNPHVLHREFPSGFTTFQLVLALLGSYGTGS